MNTKPEVLKELRQIPGVGKSIAEDLYAQGFRSVAELNGQDPQKMYDHQCALQGQHLDPCLLYTFCCAVYFASNTNHDPGLLKWWNWKDRN